ncbi:peptidase M1 [Burkholderia ubonensis]|uniref:Aminopeptidase N n=1 Tax=Burkholderia ubonensis TaxID=101571 RepID=A0A104ID60_9BURK|nr:M1 family metallopeptidase [Burkholderia ubonensis]AJX17621.1 peptidase M1 family protein [Burkholderia ubonensis MSMB22]AOK22280.1 peptidase M1 [Burkholderia ubonensis]KVD09105.1 peptidase M1 [Burkholderia ubonensis]KVD31725.1 peptidase M1 [Burkholderia ubonensis]KVD48803.1 peptidase M1 [Burkholderia ubonensis]
MWMNIRKMRYLPMVAALALAGCGGDDGGVGSASALGAAGKPNGASTPAASQPAASNIDKSAHPVELPDTVVPVNYRLWFRPNDALNAFDGRADVEIKVLKPVSSIVVAGHRIKFTNGRVTLQPGNIQLIATPQDKGDFYQLRPASGTISPGSYSLHMEWSGIINFKTYDDPVNHTGGSCGDDPYPGCSAAEGVFRVDLKATDGTTSGAILTQGETNLSRQWFPGWDEPAFRPTYEVTAEVPQNWRVVSNGAEKPSTNVGGGYKLVSFEKTPPMPSYLLFFGGGLFDTYEDDFSSPLPDGKGLHLRVFTPPGMRDWAQPAMQRTKQALDFYYRYTGIPLPLKKFDTVAANDAFKAEKNLNFGGMENWGSILEFADDILPEPGKPMSRYGNQVLTHEVAHQWFGDLVTADWWDNVWLNESFARFFEVKTTIQFFPDEFSWLDQVTNKYRVINRDIGPNAFPVAPNFNGWASNDFVVSASAFVYNKGAHVLKTIENFVGEQPLRQGLQQYLTDYSFGNGTPKRLWDAVSKSTGQAVGPIGDSYVRQTGVPLVSLDTQCDLTKNQTIVTLKQQPFPNKNPYPGTQWTVPITLAYGQGLANRTTYALKDTQAQIRIDGCTGVVADPSGLDYYVVNYSDAAWSGLLTQVNRSTDPVLLANLKSEAALLVANNLAPASRSTSIGSIASPAATLLRMTPRTNELTTPQEHPALRYQGTFTPRKVLTQ